MDVTLENSNIKDQIRNLQQTYEVSMDKLREKQRQLEVAQVENQLLKMKVKSWNVDFLLTLLSFFSLSSYVQLFHFLFSVLLLVRFPNRLWPAPQGWLEGTEAVSVSDCQSRRGS